MTSASFHMVIVRLIGRTLLWAVRIWLLMIPLAPVIVAATLGWEYAGLRGVVGSTIIAGAIVVGAIVFGYRLLITYLASTIASEMKAAMDSLDEPTVFDSVERHCGFEGYEYDPRMVYPCS